MSLFDPPGGVAFSYLVIKSMTHTSGTTTDDGGLMDFYHNRTNSILQPLKRNFWKIADVLFRISTMTTMVIHLNTSHPRDLYFHLNCQLASPPRLGTPPFVRSAPKRLFLTTQKGRCVRIHTRTLPEGVMFDINVFNTSVHSKRHTLPAEQGFGDRQIFFVLSGSVQ